MYCTQCGMPYDENQVVCSHCCTELPIQPETEEKALPKKGRLWVPIAVLAVMLIVGVAVYLFNQPGSGALIYGSNPSFSIQNGILLYEPTLDTTNGAPIVPSMIGSVQITRITDRCFAGCTKLRGVKLPEGLKQIDNYAFKYCENLEAVYIPGSVENMGQFTFYGCTKLRHVFYGGTLAQWEARFGDVLPENCQLHIVTGNEQKNYYTP